MIVNDQGLYGEYLMTMYVEDDLKKHGTYGRIFNSVIIPKTDGDFNEADVICVSERGIQVIEVKTRAGTFRGNYTNGSWQQKLGSSLNDMENPILQNQNHCNYLIEYLHTQLPECSLKEKVLFEYVWNICVFAMKPTFFNLGVDRPSGTWVADLDIYDSNKLDTSKSKLTKAEVDMISGILEKISSYAPIQKENMIRERAINQNSKMYSHQYTYYVVKLFVGDKGLDLICRDNDYYKSYMFDGLWRAIPNGEVIGRSKETADFNEIATYYHQLAN